MRPKRHFTPQQKVAILREYLKNKTSISEIAKNHDIHPNMIYLLEKSLFEGALDTFSKSSSKQSSAGNSTYPKAAVQCTADTFVVNQTV